MSLSEFTIPVENGMRVKHGVEARFTVTAGKTVLEDRLLGIEWIGGAITTAGIMYNRLSMSGGVQWWNPTTGKPVRRPKIKVRVRPEDVLTGDQLCTCSICTD